MWPRVLYLFHYLNGILPDLPPINRALLLYFASGVQLTKQISIGQIMVCGDGMLWGVFLPSQCLILNIVVSCPRYVMRKFSPF